MNAILANPSANNQNKIAGINGFFPTVASHVLRRHNGAGAAIYQRFSPKAVVENDGTVYRWYAGFVAAILNAVPYARQKCVADAVVR